MGGWWRARGGSYAGPDCSVSNGAGGNGSGQWLGYKNGNDCRYDDYKEFSNVPRSCNHRRKPLSI